METKFTEVLLEEVLTLDIQSTIVDDVENYQIAGIFSFGRGLFKRGPLLGSDTTYKKLHMLSKDQIVISKLKGWEGAIARVTQDFNGWFLSPQFPTFKVRSDIADVRYVEWFCKLSNVWTQLQFSSHGIGARRDTVSPELFLALNIPLPDKVKNDKASG